MKILLSEAHHWVPGRASRSKIYEDAKQGRLSTSPHPKNDKWKAVDIAELERVYGSVSDPEARQKDSETDDSGTQIDVDMLIQSYENRIADLQKQLDVSNRRETTLNTEKIKASGYERSTSRLNGRKTSKLVIAPVCYVELIPLRGHVLNIKIHPESTAAPSLRPTVTNRRSYTPTLNTDKPTTQQRRQHDRSVWHQTRFRCSVRHLRENLCRPRG